MLKKLKFSSNTIRSLGITRSVKSLAKRYVAITGRSLGFLAGFFGFLTFKISTFSNFERRGSQMKVTDGLRDPTYS